MKTLSIIIRNRRPLKQTRMLSVLLIAAALVVPFRTPVAAGNGDFDVNAFSFQVPSVLGNGQIDNLITLTRSFNLPPGTANSLNTKLQFALNAIDSSDPATACSFLTAFTNECAAQSGKKLTTDQATQLINSANLIKYDLGCQ